MYLFDTDTLSNIVKKRPSEFLLEKLNFIGEGSQFTTSINIGEIYYGAIRSDRKDKILTTFETYIFPSLTVLPFDEESGKQFGALKAHLEQRGIGCSESDLRIAAVSIQHDLILVTGNVKHFKNIPGLKYENWIK